MCLKQTKIKQLLSAALIFLVLDGQAKDARTTCNQCTCNHVTTGPFRLCLAIALSNYFTAGYYLCLYLLLFFYRGIFAFIMNRSEQGLTVLMSVMSSSCCVVNAFLELVKVGDMAISNLATGLGGSLTIHQFNMPGT